MKKVVVSVLAAGASSLACAQSSVTLFGGVDVAWQRVNADGTGHLNRLINGGSLTSRLGFRGVEDLGGGYAASFWLEAGLNGDTGAGSATNTNNQASGTGAANGITFNRRSTVSLSGPFGEIRLGRTENPLFWNQTLFDPFRTQGAGASINITTGAGLGTSVGLGGYTAGRISNSFSYLLPKMNGWYGQVTHGLGENLSNAAGGTKDDGRYLGGRVGYEAGPVHAAAAATRTTYAAGDIRTANIGASYSFGWAALMGQVGREDRQGAAASRATYWLLGATVPMGPGYLRGSIGATNVAGSPNDASLAAIGYVYTLSRRSSVYTALARIDNKGSGKLFHQGAPVGQPGGQSTAFDLGIRHDF